MRAIDRPICRRSILEASQVFCFTRNEEHRSSKIAFQAHSEKTFTLDLIGLANAIDNCQIFGSDLLRSRSRSGPPRQIWYRVASESLGFTPRNPKNQVKRGIDPT